MVVLIQGAGVTGWGPLLQTGSQRAFWVTLDAVVPSCCCSYQCFSRSPEEWEPPVSLLILLKGKPDDLPRGHHQHLFTISRTPKFACIFSLYPVVSPIYADVPFTPFNDIKDQPPVFIQQLLATVPLLWVKQKAFTGIHSTFWSRSMKVKLLQSESPVYRGKKYIKPVM